MHFVCLIIGDNYNENMEKYTEGHNGILHKYYIFDNEEDSDLFDGSDVESWVMEYAGVPDYVGKELVDEKGRKYTWIPRNPCGKWDYWLVGGRWKGLLKLKPGREGNTGAGDIPKLYQEGRKALERLLAEQMPGAVISGHDEFTLPPDGFCDQARFGDIDWESMNDDPEKREAFGFIWYGLMFPEEERDEEFQRKFPGWCEFDNDYITEKYGSEQRFIDSNVGFSTSAVLTADGTWHEPQCGRFGRDILECREDREQWEASFWDRFLKDLPDNTLITVADCHI